MDEKLKQVISQVSSQTKEEKEKAQEFIQLVVFELDNEEYAVPITDLREIIKTAEITPIPNAPDFIKGILNLRGKIAVVIDLGKRFNLISKTKEEGNKHIIITEVGNNTFGVTVDEVSEVIRVPIAQIQATPDLVSSKIQSDYIRGVVIIESQKKEEKADKKENEQKEEKADKKTSSRLIVLLDLPKMLEDRELLRLGEDVQEAVKIEK